jgi:molybdate transport system substrate-binding protein
MQRSLRFLLVRVVLAFAASFGGATQAETARVAAASDLKFAFDELKPWFEQTHPPHRLELIMGSSGKFFQQIHHGAPFDLFFSADVDLPKQLVARSKAITPVTTYALGRIVLWSAKVDASRLRLQDLERSEFRKIAIAAPDHAPYGARAKEALQASGVWPKVESRLVFGENIAQTAQLVDQQAAEVGIVALSLALSEPLRKKGAYALIPQELHQPLEQAFVLTTHGQNNAAARAFADFMRSAAARRVMVRYGFVLPGEAAP